MKTTLIPFGYTGKSRSPIAGGVVMLGGDSVNMDTHRGEPWPSRGFTVSREVGDSHSKACASWVHTHTDGGQTPVYYYDTALYPETGSDNPSAIKGSVTASFKSVFVNQSFPSGMSAWFNGTNAESQLIQEISAALDARTFNYTAPTTIAVTHPVGGSLDAGDYHVKITGLDKDGAITVESAPYEETVTVAANDSIDIDITGAGFLTRTTHWRVYIAKTTNSASLSFQEGADIIFSTKTDSVAALAGTTSITHINEFIRQAHLPLDSVTCAALHQGRLFVGSDQSNKVYFSERDNPNHWYTVNEVSAGAESSWSGGVIGLISAYNSLYVFTQNSIHRVFGSLTRDDQGDNPTYILDIGQAIVDTTRGLTGPNAVTTINGAPFFMSDQGLASITANGSVLIAPDDAQGQLDDLDHTYRDRWVVQEDPNGYICVLVTRLTNATRPQDGASVAGIADRIQRYDYRHGIWAAPLAVGDITHLNYRTDGAAGALGGEPKLMAANYTGRICELGIAWSGGVLDVSGTEYDGQVSTTEATTSVIYTESGKSADDYNGFTVTLKYPDADTGYPGVTVQKTITDMGVAGSVVTLHWQGALTAPSGSGTWTVRPTGLLRIQDARFDAGQLPGIEPGSKARIKGVRVILQHVVGVESIG